jgi:hypothetical protein
VESGPTVTAESANGAGRGRPLRRILAAALHGSAFVPTAAVAVTLTLSLPGFYGDWNPGGRSGYTNLPSIFLIIEPLVVIAAWGAVWAYLRRSWTLAGLCLLVSVFGPWGINFVLALIPLSLGLLLLVVALTNSVAARTSSR